MKIERESSVLMNPSRQQLFRYLCRYPCSYLSEIARSMGISPPTAKWHLDKLCRGGLVQAHKIGKKTVYYPMDMVGPSDVPVLALMNHPQTKRLFLGITKEPGLTQKELSKLLEVRHQVVIWHATRLQEVGLITTVLDGRYTRYFPSTTLKELVQKHNKRAKTFRESLLRALTYDGVAPKIVRTSSKTITLQITSGTKRKSITLDTSPFTSVLKEPRF